MRKLMFGFAFALVAAFVVPLFGGAAPAAAHGGHTSCAGGIIQLVSNDPPDDGRTYLPQGPGEGPSGAVVKFLGTNGLVAGAALLAHEEFCDTD